MKLERLKWNLLGPLGVAAGWEVLVRLGLVHPLFFPPPSVLLPTAWELVAGGELPARLSTTLARMAGGFLIGSAAGLLVGLLMGGFQTFRRAVEPLISALNATPKLTLLPLLMVLVGVGEAARLALIGLAAFLVLAMHGLDAVREISRTYVEMASNYGAGRLQLFRRIYLPASLPMVFTGIRVALGRTLVITLSAELIGASDGLGGMIWLAWQTFSTERLYVGVFTSALMGAALHLAAGFLETHLIPWRAHGEAV
jgi:NitT/TauT family transport system permease protein